MIYFKVKKLNVKCFFQLFSIIFKIIQKKTRSFKIGDRLGGKIAFFKAKKKVDIKKKLVILGKEPNHYLCKKELLGK